VNRLILIRHGQSEHHIQGLTGGWTEYVANALGIECRLDPALREINNGVSVGMTWQEAEQIELPATEPE
jgi:broad specificity phosphatase PhoE